MPLFLGDIPAQLNHQKCSNEASGLLLLASAGAAILAASAAISGIKNFNDKRVRQYIDQNYADLCKYIRQNKKTDSYFFTEKRNIASLPTIISCMEKAIKLYKLVLAIPAPVKGETAEAYINKLRPRFKQFEDNWFLWHEYKKPQSFAEAGYFNATSVKRVFELDAMFSSVWESVNTKLNKMFFGTDIEEYLETYCERGDNMRDVLLFYAKPKCNAQVVFDNIKLILKPIKSEYEKSKNQ